MQQDDPAIGVDMIIGYALIASWLAGMLLANSPLSALAAFLCPPWAWILVAGRVLGLA